MPLGPSEVFMREATVRAAMMLIYHTQGQISQKSLFKPEMFPEKLEAGRFQIENQIWLVPH